MAKVVMSVMVEKWSRLVQVEEVFHPGSIEEAVRLIDELWGREARNRYWECVRYSPLMFECRDKDRPDKKLSVVWIPESLDDLIMLVYYVASRVGEARRDDV